jgi:hypothetical protein
MQLFRPNVGGEIDVLRRPAQEHRRRRLRRRAEVGESGGDGEREDGGGVVAPAVVVGGGHFQPRRCVRRGRRLGGRRRTEVGGEATVTGRHLDDRSPGIALQEREETACSQPLDVLRGENVVPVPELHEESQRGRSVGESVR